MSQVGNPYGKRSLGTSGHRLSVIFNDNGLGWKEGGVTIDWSTVTAHANDATYPDDVLVKAGEKALPAGQILVPITLGQRTSLTTGGADGTYTITVDGEETTALDHDANAGTIEAAIEALPNVGAGKGTVTGSAGNFTIDFDPSLGNLDVSVEAVAPATAAVALVASADRYGMYGPYDSAATDGRGATPTKGRCFILPHLVHEADDNPYHVGVIEKGNVYKERIKATNSSASLANGPTWANLLAAMPGVYFKEVFEATYNNP